MVVMMLQCLRCPSVSDAPMSGNMMSGLGRLSLHRKQLCARVSDQVLAVEEAVGGGFGEVFGADVGGTCQVGDGAGQADDA